MPSNNHLTNVDFYRLAINANMLAKQADLIHSLKSINPNAPLSDEDLTMLKTLTQVTLDYAQSIIEKETSYHE